jgi:hypothetical protein
VSVAACRLILAIQDCYNGTIDPLNSFGFSVVLPLTALLLINSMVPSRTREGLLMRFGTVLHLVLVMALPEFALHLLLGLPVVFLIVELFEARVPPALRDRLVKIVVQ